jgi:Mg2+-importing ATPase
MTAEASSDDISQSAYWSQPPEALLAALGTSPNGLTSADAAQRLERYGPNTLKARRKDTALALFLSQFKSPIIMILLFATLISIAVGDLPDAIIILVIVLGSALLSFFQEHSASRAAEKLRAQVRIKTSVLRDGQPCQVASEEVVPGDIVLLSAGSLIPADGVVLEARDFFVGQAVLTGETFPVEKKAGPVPADAGLAARTNTVFMGTTVRSGSARAVVARTGTATAFGHIAARLALRPPETAFEHGIRQFGYLLTEVTFVLLLIVFGVNVYFKATGSNAQHVVLESLLFSLALAVGLTPQLLPAIININLSRGSQRMAAHGVIVRRLASIENFGSMDVLCTDKTGTLTEGVVRLDGALDMHGQPSDSILRYAYLNAHFQTGLANPLDEAILAQPHPDTTGMDKLEEIPYDFVRKRLSVVVDADPGSAVRPLLITKGALDNVLAICTQALDGERVVPLDSAHRAAIAQRHQDWCGQGFRVLGVAIRDVPRQTAYHVDTDERQMIFAGFLLFFDPPKADVRDTIGRLANLGVSLKIITGDNRLVAMHTAEAVGLPVTGMLTGADLDRTRDEALPQAALRTNLFVEVDPNQKERIILALKKTGHVVSYMGDGINDAPALHAADVGISVDSAVDVAKEAADFVLSQHSLDALEEGIEQGRRTFANTLKYVFMATSANFGNMFSVAGASLFLPFLPMLPKQILLINFLTDMPEMTIAGDNVDRVVLQKPRRWDIHFIRRFMIVFGLLSSVFDYLTFGVLWLFLRLGQDPPAHESVFHTGWFVESVLSASLVVFALRTRLPCTRSRPSRAMLAVTAAMLVVTLVLPYSPLAGLLGFEPLPALFLAAVGALVAAYFLSAELLKRWFYRKYR